MNNINNHWLILACRPPQEILVNQSYERWPFTKKQTRTHVDSYKRFFACNLIYMVYALPFV